MTALFASLLGGQDWIVLLVLGFLLFVVFGRRLPEVGRSIGKGIVEFKKGIKGLEDEADTTSYSSTPPPPQASAPPPEAPRPPQRITAAAPKFDDRDHQTTNGDLDRRTTNG
jgi:sec-independent protein translocase protein TatA